ncbi:MAG: UDP-N-acetylmuramate dehydrogenase [Oscillospiraceae bacterium]|nr:UDP-N-acetylmuramate dehydrogenase [Oscillospiraceae bacterium]
MTDFTEFQKKISTLLPHLELRLNEPMFRHTSFKIGGAVEVMAFPKNAEELSKLLKASALLDCKIAILGAGTNILAPDEGLSGLVICLKDCLDGMERVNDTTIRVMAGVTMTRAAVFAANLGLGGMEFAHGIPGTVGGGVYMNAGAYDGEIKDICTRVEVMDMQGQTKVLTGEEMGFSYRHSRLEEEAGIVIAAEFSLNPKPTEQIRARMKELMEKRSNSQPLDMPSAGSAFKRPVGGFAAKLIDEAGLRGFQVGNAGVSQKHTGFVVNLGGATAKNVKDLLTQVSDKVFEKSGIRLEPEVRIW